ncbi:hypothetical protein KM043_018684 [Ampulex compressa]|nr:hypothetical protein KM043_018684 [Ampulex compressa]
MISNREDDHSRESATTRIEMLLPDQQKLLEPQTRNAQICVELKDVCYSVPQRKGKAKQILKNVYGCFRPGRLTVVIGQSGAGKTSLLKIIFGLHNYQVNGTVLVNGAVRGSKSLRKQACYIPQEFNMLPLLTTRETLYIAARLKLNDGHKSPSPHMIVRELAKSLGLTSCLDTMTEKLSGGERKRLSIGVEIVTKPSILLLDEPTSGLDSASSMQVITLLQNMAQSGCTVVCTVHQPSSQMISRFDDILVLNEGKSMYCGPQDCLLPTLSSAAYVCPQFYNIAEFVLEIITGQRGGDLEYLYKINFEKYIEWKSQKQCPANGEESATPMTEYYAEEQDDILTDHTRPLSIWQQQRILFYRAMLCIRRDNTMTKLRLAAHFVVALLLGAVFYDFGNDASKTQSNIACIFFFVLFLFFSNAMPAVQIFPVEAAVLLQEHANNWYRLSSYYIVKLLSDIPLQIVCPCVFILAAYYLTGQPMECERILKTCLIGVLITILGQSVGMITGTAFNTHIGTFLIPACSIPFLLFAGFFLKLGEIPFYMQPLSIISFYRYAFEGMMQAIYGGDREKLICLETYCQLRLPVRILTTMDMPSMTFQMIVLALATWIVIIYGLTYAILRWKIYTVKT